MLNIVIMLKGKCYAQYNLDKYTGSGSISQLNVAPIFYIEVHCIKCGVFFLYQDKKKTKKKNMEKFFFIN
jgi:hypothetical protein